ncbi:acyl-CoA carboxylase subunit epsilon [Streptomyces sp. NBC_00299]|uniref:acyl-CoA carboxylase subunit epsilon n=1 Tax=Streptomyces sp. NBC_00299 TaxID=2975705 RepID=UPI002E2A77A3|nr:acyl-CoA carboxylase subunit epsilon [Streptomyces sp. NBC_00299]
MSAVKVVRGKPSEEELAAVLAVLLSVGQQPDAPTGSDRAKSPLRQTRWSRGGRAYPAPAASWKFAS